MSEGAFVGDITTKIHFVPLNLRSSLERIVKYSTMNQLLRKQMHFTNFTIESKLANLQHTVIKEIEVYLNF